MSRRFSPPLKNEECPICLETDTKLIILCCNKHGVCENCIICSNTRMCPLYICPICRESLTRCIKCNRADDDEGSNELFCDNNHCICRECLVELTLDNFSSCPACDAPILNYYFQQTPSSIIGLDNFSLLPVNYIFTRLRNYHVPAAFRVDWHRFLDKCFRMILYKRCMSCKLLTRRIVRYGRRAGFRSHRRFFIAITCIVYVILKLRHPDFFV